MTASPNIKTPAMEVPLHRLPQAQSRGEELKKHFTRVCLSQVPMLCVCRGKCRDFVMEGMLTQCGVR